MEVGWKLFRAFSSSNARSLARGEDSPKRVRGVGLSRELPKVEQAQPSFAKCHRHRALLPSDDTRCWRAGIGVCHADPRPESAAAEIAPNPASAPLYCRILCVVWACGRACVFGGMSDATSLQNLFRPINPDGAPVAKRQVFLLRLSRPVGKNDRNSWDQENCVFCRQCQKARLDAKVGIGPFRPTVPTA